MPWWTVQCAPSRSALSCGTVRPPVSFGPLLRPRHQAASQAGRIPQTRTDRQLQHRPGAAWRRRGSGLGAPVRGRPAGIFSLRRCTRCCARRSMSEGVRDRGHPRLLSPIVGATRLAFHSLGFMNGRPVHLLRSTAAAGVVIARRSAAALTGPALHGWDFGRPAPWFGAAGLSANCHGWADPDRLSWMGCRLTVATVMTDPAVMTGSAGANCHDRSRTGGRSGHGLCGHGLRSRLHVWTVATVMEDPSVMEGCGGRGEGTVMAYRETGDRHDLRRCCPRSLPPRSRARRGVRRDALARVLAFVRVNPPWLIVFVLVWKNGTPW